MDAERLRQLQLEAEAEAEAELEIGDSSWNLLDSAKQFGAGAVRGTLSTVGMLGDAARGITGQFSPQGGLFPVTEQIISKADEYLPERDPKYRYSETVGEFVGPGGVAKGLGMLGKAAGMSGPFLSGMQKFGSGKEIILDAASGLGAQGAVDVTGEEAIAPVVGAVGTRAALSVGDEALRALGRFFSGASDERTLQSAAAILKDYTKLTPEQIKAGIASAADDPLREWKSTAELTGNAPMAQLQQQLTGAGDGAAELANRSRDRLKAQTKIINSGSTVDAVNPEGLGTELVKKALLTEEGMEETTKQKWQAFPREEFVDVSKNRGEVLDILEQHSKESSLDIDRDTKRIVSAFLGGESGEAVLPSGKLQTQRHEALTLLRDKPGLQNVDRRLLAAVSEGTDAAIKAGVAPETYGKWIDARDATSKKAEIFGRGTAGGSLIDPRTRPSQVVEKSFKGDAQGVEEVTKAIGGDTKLLEKYKRGVIDLINTDAQGRLTTNSVKRFLDSNEGGIVQLYGGDYYKNAHKVLEDMRSSDNVGELATLASKRQSPTAQRTSTAAVIGQLFASKIVPGLSGPVAAVAASIKDSLGAKAGAKIEALLLKAVFDPEFAAVLAGAPTEGRIMTVLERFATMVGNVTKSGARGGLLGGNTTDKKRKRGPFIASEAND